MALREYAGAAKRTALSGDITAASTTITVADATGYPTGATGPFAIALELGNAAEEKVLIASRSGNTLTVDTRGYDGTTAAAHSSGSNVDHVLTAIDVREANTHINATTGAHPATAISFSPAAGVAATTVQAAIEEVVSDASAAYAAKDDYPGTAWAAYTPVLGGAGWAIGNGSISGRWTRAGKIVSFVVEIAFGSTSTFGAGQPTVTPPVPCSAGFFYTDGLYYDASAGGSWRAYCEVNGSVIYWKTNANPTAAVSSTVPFTWANGDIVRLNGTYEG